MVIFFNNRGKILKKKKEKVNLKKNIPQKERKFDLFSPHNTNGYFVSRIY